MIAYQLPGAAVVRLVIYNALGRCVNTLVDGVQEAGYHRVEWSGCDGEGVPVPAGWYIYRLEVGYRGVTRRLFIGSEGVSHQ